MGATQNAFWNGVQPYGFGIERGHRLPWLTNRGHRNPHLQGRIPEVTINALAGIYHELGGDEALLLTKRAGNDPSPDFSVPKRSLLLEVDEIQHFTSDRAKSLRMYPDDVDVAFDVASYADLCNRWATKADLYRSTKPTSDFPFPGGRRAQRAYFDAVRDLLAPHFGLRVLRVHAPECDGAVAVERLRALLG